VQCASSPKLQIGLQNSKCEQKIPRERCNRVTKLGMMLSKHTFRGSDLRCQRPDILNRQEVNEALSPDECIFIYKPMYPCLSQGGQRGWASRNATPIPVIPNALLRRIPDVGDQKLLFIIRIYVSALEKLCWCRLLLDLLRRYSWCAGTRLRHDVRWYAQVNTSSQQSFVLQPSYVPRIHGARSGCGRSLACTIIL
jgi:hypothetical protein